jgi:aminopeptidase-like protein
MAEQKKKSQPSEPLSDLVRRLYPICRSITGDGVRDTLSIVSEWLPLEVFEVPTGTRVFDWTVPNEWNVREAYVATLDGNRVIDFRHQNLHVLNYSGAIDAVISRDELDNHLYSLPDHPDWIPYRTSYYAENWGFCVTQHQRDGLTDPAYRVVIDADLAPGSLTYAECFVQGESKQEVVLYTHICHPSLCNDNLSGIAVAAALGKALSACPRRHYSYRLVFGPGTIGSITWLSQNKERLKDIAHGLVIGLLGDDANFTYKRSRGGSNEIDDVVTYVLSQATPRHEVIDFSPYGYDERQFGSPGINLPVGRLTRSVNGGYAAYHSSGDDLSIVSEARLQESLEIVTEILDTLEGNRRYINLSPNCEPQLGKRGLYRGTGGTEIADRESAMLWLLNQSDGTSSLLDIARKSGIKFSSLTSAADELRQAGLLDVSPE